MAANLLFDYEGTSHGPQDVTVLGDYVYVGFNSGGGIHKIHISGSPQTVLPGTDGDMFGNITRLVAGPDGYIYASKLSALAAEHPGVLPPGYENAAIYRVHPTDGNPTLWGWFSSAGVSGVPDDNYGHAFGADGSLYTSDVRRSSPGNNAVLYRHDPAGGLSVDAYVSPVNNAWFTGLDSDGDHILMGSADIGGSALRVAEFDIATETFTVTTLSNVTGSSFYVPSVAYLSEGATAIFDDGYVTTLDGQVIFNPDVDSANPGDYGDWRGCSYDGGTRLYVAAHQASHAVVAPGPGDREGVVWIDVTAPPTPRFAVY